VAPLASMTFAGREGFSEVDGGDRARHRMAEECALKRNVSAKLTSELPPKPSAHSEESVAEMPCNVLSYEPVITWTVTGSAVLDERSLIDVELNVVFLETPLLLKPTSSSFLLFRFPIVYQVRWSSLYYYQVQNLDYDGKLPFIETITLSAKAKFPKAESRRGGSVIIHKRAAVSRIVMYL